MDWGGRSDHKTYQNRTLEALTAFYWMFMSKGMDESVAWMG